MTFIIANGGGEGDEHPILEPQPKKTGQGDDE